MDDVWDNERRLWQEGADAYDELMAPECVMAFGPLGIMERPEIVGSMRDAPRWSDVNMTDTTQTRPADNISIIAYRALAMRSGVEPYEAVCTSTYVTLDGHWKLVQHQQSVVLRAWDAP
ncbi:MAG TPA: DUF4440 domain-containing protein [Devosia sp.]|nr:DUF4440 domain-containing protein [Devosia sp.]